MAFELITLNLIPSGDVPVIHAAQYDVDRPLNFALKLGEDDFNPSGYTLELQIRKVDNNIVTAAPASVSSNVVTFNTTEQMCACSGTNLGEIQITKDDLDIATLHFYLVVQRDVLAGGLTSASEIHDLEEQIAELVPSVIGDEYYTSEEVDEKIAEIPTFDPSDYYDKTQLYTKTETNGLLSQKANTSSLATVATSGSYNDLLNKPNIPDVSDYYTKEETYSQNEVNTLLSAKADTSSLATVATSGDYTDLTNKPTIPAAQVNSDWNSSSGVSEILNKPTLATVATSGDYTDLTNKPTIIQYGTDLPMSTTEPNSMVADRIEALEKVNFTVAKGSTMPTGFPIPNVSRRGHVCIINFAIQLPAGTYTNSDILWVLSVTPIANTRSLVNVGGIQLVNVLTDGTVRFNSNVTLSSVTYILGQAVFMTDS